MPHRPLSPKGRAAPLARYSPGMQVAAGSELVFVSGQLGLRLGAVGRRAIGSDAELCFQAIGAILAEAGMGFADIVRLNAFVTERAYLPDYMRVRDRHIADPPPASTLMIVQGFSQPQFKVEVECVAAKQKG